MRFYTEVLKIIEGGLRKDTKKVSDYATLLAKKLQEEGEIKKAERIEKLLLKTGYVKEDIITSASTQVPFDNETKLEIATIVMPYQIEEKVLFYSPSVRKQIDEFIASYKESDRLASYGLDIPSTLLLYGPPGCGKTELASFVAKELGIPIVIARLDTLISSYLGSTSKNIRMLFEYAAKNPCVLFLDEFDAIAKLRDDKNEQGELKRVVNSLLQNIDFINDKSIIIGATNHEGLLDKAIWRRFSTRLHINYPTNDIRTELITQILSDIGYNTYRKNFIDVLASLFDKLSIADIEQILKRSVRGAILENREVGFLDFIEGYFNYVGTDIDFNGDADTVRREKLKFLLNIDPTFSHRMLGEILNCHHNTIRSDLKKIQMEMN
ncbi:AAA family ATPase [Rummeliibacillus suwonensis]|uniref:AAA family ATPase n=1 Tax=Rummeliibacillus suwonensis TaxID=1306154 RepID=UPI0011B5FA8A|nr:ATP-binding protein [Rummeliibacillus suwonensis]